MPSVFSRLVFRTELDSATAAGRATAVRHPSAARGGPYLAGGQTLISSAGSSRAPGRVTPRPGRVIRIGFEIPSTVSKKLYMNRVRTDYSI